MKRHDVKRKNKILSLIKIAKLYSPFYFILSLILTIVEGLMVPFMLFTVAKFIDAAMTVASANPEIRTMLILDLCQ